MVHPVQAINMYTYLRLSDVAQRCGFDVEALLAFASLKADAQHRHSERLPLTTIARLFEFGIREGHQQYFPLALAESFSFDFFPEVETFLATSPDLEEASKLLHWLPQLILEELCIDLDPAGGLPRLQLKVEEALVMRGSPRLDAGLLHSIEDSILCCILLFMHKLRVPLQGIVLHFCHAAHPALSAFAVRMGIAAVFGAGFTGLTAPHVLWRHPIAKPHNPIHSQTEIVIESVVQRLQRRQPLGDHLRRELRLAPMTSLAHMSGQLGMSIRKIQRQLASEGSTYQALQSAALTDLARQHLRNPSLDMESIAIKLGFSDRHSFTRAFRRLAGMTPSQFRKSLAQESP